MKTAILAPKNETKIKNGFKFSLKVQCLSIVLLLFGANKSLAYDFELDGIYYSIIDSINSTVKVTYHSKSNSGYLSGDSIIKIPSSIDYNNNLYTVTEIGNSAFYNCKNLTSITIPNSVESIGGWAFWGCTSIKEVIIEDGAKALVSDIYFDNSVSCVTFRDCPIEKLYLGRNISYSSSWANSSPFNGKSKLKNLIIGNNVTSLTPQIFRDCNGLIEVVIPSSVENIGKLAFNNCRGLKEINIPNSVTEIGGYAFQGCSGLQEMTIPNSVTSIGSMAFADCLNLESIIIGCAVDSIGEQILLNCISLNSIVIDSLNRIYDSRNNCSAIIETSTNKLISGCQSTLIPNSVESIGECAFSLCEGLTSIIIPEPVALIERRAFSGCNNLVSVIVGDSVKIIQEYAFLGCDNLEYIYIGESVKQIYPNVFNGCDKLNKVDYNAANLQISPHLDYLIFDDCPSLSDVNIGEDVQAIPPMAFYNCTSLANLTISNGLIEIGSGAFYNCCNLKEIVIPASVTSIGNSAFYGCSGLNTIIVEEGNTAYDSRNNCNAIINTESNTLICGSNRTIIPNSITSIENYAFLNCKDLTEIIIPKSVANIGKDAFFGCCGLHSIIIESENAVYDSRENCNAIIHTATNTLVCGSNKTIIPESIVSIQEYAFQGCSELLEATIPNSVTDIGGYAFKDCTNLTTISISNSLKTIPVGLFQNCTNLIELVFPESVTRIEYRVFNNCSKLVSITLPSTIEYMAIESIQDCSNLRTIYCKRAIPPNTDFPYVWHEYLYSEITLYVPIGSKSLYENQEPWSFCKVIEEMEFPDIEYSEIESAIADNDISISVENGNILIDNADNSKISIFNTNGQCVYNGLATSIPVLSKGVHIVKINNKTFKLVL